MGDTLSSTTTSGETTMSDLPPELLDAVLGHLHPEWHWDKGLDFHSIQGTLGKPGLHACSLVSRTWNAVARPHLFQEVVYSFRRDAGLETWGLGVVSSTWQYYGITARHKSFAMFCEFIRKNPAIRTFIRKLKLELYPIQTKPSYAPGYDDGKNYYKDRDRVPQGLFVELVQSLRLLDHLVLHNIVLESHLLEITLPLLSVRQFDICYDPTTAPFFPQRIFWSKDCGRTVPNILHNFGEVDELHAKLIWYEDRSDQVDLPHSPSLHVRSLVAERGYDCPHFWKYLSSCPRMFHIKRLALDDVGSSAGQKFIDAVHTTLEEFTYSNLSMPMRDSWAPQLIEYRNLRFLQFDLYLEEAQIDAIPPSVVSDLQTLTRTIELPRQARQYLPHFKELSIHIFFDLSASIDEIPMFEKLDREVQMSFRSFQTTLLQSIDYLALPGIWVECSTGLSPPHERPQDLVRQFRDVIEDLFAMLKEDEKLLWRDPCEKRWPFADEDD